MPTIKLYELGPTRSARCRWILNETELPYESAGNNVEVFADPELLQVHPLGKLPAAIIDGRPLFESAAIATAIADLAPDKNLIAKPGSWGRALHEQWVCFALSEMECWVSSTELNSDDFVLPKEQHIPAIIEQNNHFFRKSAAVLDRVLAEQPFLVEDRFTVTDIIMGYTLNFGEEQGLTQEYENITAYMERLYERPHCTLRRH